MEYDEFDVEYRRVLDGAARLSTETPAAEIDRGRVS